MSAPPFDAIVAWIGSRLLVGSGEAIILVSVVWFACRRANLSAAMQATLWWLAAVKVVIVLLPLPAVTLSVLPAPTAIRTIAADVVDNSATAGPTAVIPRADVRPATAVTWSSLGVTVWLMVVIAHAVRLFGQHLHVRRIVRRSVPSGDEVAPLASAVGLRRIPAVHSSSDIDAPQVVGVVRPVILMPSAPMTEADRIMALSHELMHVRRGDLALGWIPALAERVFFFHPLVRLAAREYHTAREAACDAAVVRALGVPAGDYGRLLLRFGVASGQPAFVAGGASRSLSSLRRRLAMLQQSSSNGSRRIGWALGAVMVLAMIPIQLVAQAPANRGARIQEEPKTVYRSTITPPRELILSTEPELVLAQEARESTEAQHQLLELQNALRAAQAEDAARTYRAGRNRAEVESILRSIEEQRSSARNVEREMFFDQRARDEYEKTLQEYEKMLKAERLKENTVSPQDVMVAQLDSLRRSIDELNMQLAELRKMEQRLREQLRK